MKQVKKYTLIELLVTLSIISILTTLLISALKVTRDETVKIECRNNQKEIVVGYTSYAGDHNGQVPFFSQTTISRAYAWSGALGLSDTPVNMARVIVDGYMSFPSKSRDNVRYCPSDSESQNASDTSGYVVYLPDNIAGTSNSLFSPAGSFFRAGPYKLAGKFYDNWIGFISCLYLYPDDIDDSSKNPHSNQGVNVANRDGSAVWLPRPILWPGSRYNKNTSRSNVFRDARFWRLASGHDPYED